MQIPQKPALIRSLLTTSLDELANFQENKNRRYIQLQSGKLNARYIEANLGNTQLFKESLNVGTRIEAAPAKHYIPFAFIYPRNGEHRFCGREHIKSSLVQAGGGVWDVCSKNNLDYICTAFNREYFHNCYDLLIEQEVPSQFLLSQTVQTSSQELSHYVEAMDLVLKQVQLYPVILQQKSLVNLICSQLAKLAIDVLSSTTQPNHSLKPQPKRIKGVQRVIEYLQTHAEQLPDMSTLCKAANLSERSLEYGFKEHLGISPIRYLRLVRLNYARHDLAVNTGAYTKVSDVALKWGFLEFGRFSGEYKQLFQESPSKTLQNSTN
jgi:AraC family ethanolamine operon transcriptional activator